MNKDALLATLIGFGIGLVITGGFLFGPNLAKSFPTISFSLPTLPFWVQKQEVPSPIPTPQALPSELAISAPQPDSIATSDKATVSGSAPPGSTLVVTGPRDESVAVTGDNGTFSGSVSLVEGKNEIAVSAYINGGEQTKTLTIFYTPEAL